MKRERESEPEAIFDILNVKKEMNDAVSPPPTTPPPAADSSNGKTTNWFGITASYDIVKDRPTGHVQIQWVNSYDGEALNGLRHGTGVHIDAEKREKYEGQFYLGRRHGKGKLTRPGYTYEGEFANDVCHGSGTVSSKNGKYSGNWNYGKEYGMFTGEKADGTKITCEFFSGLRHGIAVTTYPDGRVVHSKWNHGKLVK